MFRGQVDRSHARTLRLSIHDQSEANPTKTRRRLTAQPKQEAVEICLSSCIKLVPTRSAMSEATRERTSSLLVMSQDVQPQDSEPDQARDRKGFGGGRAAKVSRRKGANRRTPALSKGDWGPLGKHPSVEAIVARQRLHLPLSGRLTAALVNQAWKRCASQHHPDRGGEHDTMQLVNGARDLLLGRDLS